MDSQKQSQQGPDGRDGKSQRDALERAQEAASEKQPETFRDQANADKVVDIGHDKTKHPIEGIDPPEGQGR